MDSHMPMMLKFHRFMVDIPLSTFFVNFFVDILKVTRICWLIDIQTSLVTVRNSESESHRWPYCRNVKLKCQPPVYSQLTRLIKLNYCWLRLFLPLLFSTQVFSLNEPGQRTVLVHGPWIMDHWNIFSWWESNVWYLWKSTKSSSFNATPCPNSGAKRI